MHIVDDLPCEVANSAFMGCYKLFKDKQRIDEEGGVWFDIEGKSYYIGIPDSTPSFCEEMQKYKDWWFEDELTVEELEKRIVEE